MFENFPSRRCHESGQWKATRQSQDRAYLKGRGKKPIYISMEVFLRHFKEESEKSLQSLKRKNLDFGLIFFRKAIRSIIFQGLSGTF